MRLGIALGLMMVVAVAEARGGIKVLDPLDRDVTTQGIQLLDWDGHLMNPAPTFRVELMMPEAQGQPSPAPFTVRLRANHSRLYFDNPSTFGANFPSKQLTVQQNGGRAAFRLAIFPDRAGGNETATLTIEVTNSQNRTTTRTVPITVLDQDLPRPANTLIHTNYSWDRLNWMNANRRAVIDQAAADWAYFFVNPGYATVPTNAEWTFIWNTNGFTGGSWQRNTASYNGFLLYTYAIDGPELRSGGAGSSGGGFQSVNGIPTSLRRSGTVEVELKGNYNTLGWIESTDDNQWFITGNFGNQQNDLYSIVRHEMGHALGFNIAYPNFLAAKNGAGITDPDVVNILGGPMPIDPFDHFHGTIEPCSACGAFGYEYFGGIPRRRWLPTKVDIFAMRHVGWALRDISAFWPLQWVSAGLPGGTRGAQYSQTLLSRGGNGAPDYRVTAGALPPGLQLNRFTGAITGVPTVAGQYAFTVTLGEAFDNGDQVNRNFIIPIGP